MATKSKAPPLAREELLQQMVTEADAFTALRYLRAREETPALWQMEQSGAKKLPGATAALGDVYHSLWSEGVEIKDRTKVAPSRQYWRGLLEETLPTAAFEQLHAKTRGDRLLSMMGTMEAGKTIFGLVPAEDAEKLEDAAKADADANDLEQEVQRAQDEADALAELADHMQAQAGGGPPSQDGAGGQSGVSGNASDNSSTSSSVSGGKSSKPGNGTPGSSKSASSGGQGNLTPAQAQKLANELAERWSQAQAKADTARELADLAHAEAQAKADALMGQPGSAEAEAKLRELARVGHAALSAAEKTVSELSETVQGWGLDAGELERMDMPEAVGLLQKMRNNRGFQQFAKLLGRLRAIAAKKARSETKGEGRRIPRQETGRDIARAFPSELVSLAHPATRMQTLQRWARGGLRLRGTETKRELGEGPVIVLEDSSGSMDGDKQQWAKGVTLALAHYAKLKRRDFGWVMFDSYVQCERTYKAGVLGARQLLEIAEARSGGGTNFERPIRKAVEMITKAGLKKADIVLVTDGDCAVSESFLRELTAARSAHGFSLLTVICDVGGHVSDRTVKTFSERVECVSSFTAEEAERKIFSNL